MAAAKTMQPANQQNPLAGAIQGLSKTDLSNLWSGGGAIDRALYPSGNPLQTGQYASPEYWT
jgi:hypothetical protein